MKTIRSLAYCCVLFMPFVAYSQQPPGLDTPEGRAWFKQQMEQGIQQRQDIDQQKQALFARCARGDQGACYLGEQLSEQTDPTRYRGPSAAEIQRRTYGQGQLDKGYAAQGGTYNDMQRRSNACGSWVPNC